MDIHQERISIAGAESGRYGAVEYLGEIARRLHIGEDALLFIYDQPSNARSAIVDQQHFNVDDFFMSYRVQHKNVDHAYFGWLLQKARTRRVERVTVSFRSTERNEPARQVLNETNFEELENANSCISPTLDELPRWDIVAVRDWARADS